MIHRFDIVDSTNGIALQMARDGEPEGTIITAISQLKGRGRRRRIWQDEPGQNVLMSIILRPPIPIESIHELTFVTSLAIADYLNIRFGISVLLKWPNDVLVDDKKIAGILIEQASTDEGLAVVVGIGLNVNQSQFPSELSDIATSIALLAGNRYNIPEIAETLSSNILLQYKKYLSSGFEDILTRWRKYMWGIGGQARITTEGKVIEGTIIRLDPTGALIIKGDFDTHTIHAADAVQGIANPA
jgi:BirA family biotin operon repressor/biotin-[acetyl-CoA-carboxylase] ligase